MDFRVVFNFLLEVKVAGVVEFVVYKGYVKLLVSIMINIYLYIYIDY